MESNYTEFVTFLADCGFKFQIDATGETIVVQYDGYEYHYDKANRRLTKKLPPWQQTETTTMSVKYTKEEAEASEIYKLTHPNADSCDGFIAACIAHRERKGIYNWKNFETFTEWFKLNCEVMEELDRYKIKHNDNHQKGHNDNHQKGHGMSFIWNHYNDHVKPKL